MELATWVGIAILTVINIAGWIITSNRYSRNEATHLGELGGIVKGLSDRIESLEKRVESMEKRINGLFTTAK